MKVNVPNIAASLLALATGITFLVASAGLKLGTALEMGPGYFPAVLSLVLIGLSAGLMFRAVFRGDEAVEDKEHDVAEEASDWRCPIAILGSVTAFALLLEPVGLVSATIAVVCISGIVSGVSFIRIALLSIVVAIAATVGFVELIGLNMPVFGGWFQ